MPAHLGTKPLGFFWRQFLPAHRSHPFIQFFDCSIGANRGDEQPRRSIQPDFKFLLRHARENITARFRWQGAEAGVGVSYDLSELIGLLLRLGHWEKTSTACHSEALTKRGFAGVGNELRERFPKSSAPACFARSALDCADLSALWGWWRLVSVDGGSAGVRSALPPRGQVRSSAKRRQAAAVQSAARERFGIRGGFIGSAARKRSKRRGGGGRRNLTNNAWCGVRGSSLRSE